MPRLTADQWAEIRAEYEAGASLNVVAERHGMSRAAVQKRAKAEGWTQDVAPLIRQKVAEKVAGVVAGADPQKKAQILDAAAEKGAVLIRQQQQDWEAHRELFGAVPADFEAGKHAKISAEMLRIRHEGERAAYGLDEPGGGNTELRIIIEREPIAWGPPG